MAQNACDCPHPPGGRVVCGPNQFAICRVEGGRVHSECHDVPSSIREAVISFSPHYPYELDLLAQGLFANWLHLLVTRGFPGTLRYSSEGGSFVSEQHDVSVTFRFPENMQGVIRPQEGFERGGAA